MFDSGGVWVIFGVTDQWAAGGGRQCDSRGTSCYEVDTTFAITENTTGIKYSEHHVYNTRILCMLSSREEITPKHMNSFDHQYKTGVEQDLSRIVIANLFIRKSNQRICRGRNSLHCLAIEFFASAHSEKELRNRVMRN